MFEIFQMDAPLFAASVVFAVMGSIAVAFSLLLRLRSRRLAVFRDEIAASVFNKTFNIFEPKTEHRRIVSSHVGLVIFTAVYGSWFAVTYSVFRTFEAGGVLAAIVFFLCAAMLMIDETQEIYQSAGVLARALEEGRGFAEGDLQTLAIVRSVIRRLSLFHATIGVIFFSLSLTTPIVVEAALVGSAGIAAGVMTVSSSLRVAPVIGWLLIAGLFASALVLCRSAVDNLKRRIFGFPLTVVANEQLGRMKMYVGILHHHPWIREPKPEDSEEEAKKELERHNKS